MGCTTNFVAVPTTTTITVISDGDIAFTTTFRFTGGGYNAYGVQVRFQETDFQSTTSVSHILASHVTNTTPHT